MGLFGLGKKKEQAPAQKQESEQKQVEISGPPYQQYVIVDGQWHINPKYDPSAPKPQQVKVFGLGNDDEEEEKEEDDADF